MEDVKRGLKESITPIRGLSDTERKFMLIGRPVVKRRKCASNFWRFHFTKESAKTKFFTFLQEAHAPSQITSQIFPLVFNKTAKVVLESNLGQY